MLKKALKVLHSKAKTLLIGKDLIEAEKVMGKDWGDLLTADAPIKTSVEIIDSSMVVEAAIDEVCSLLQVNPYETELHAVYERVKNPGLDVKLLLTSSTESPNEMYAERMVYEWIVSPELSTSFRKDFFSLFSRVDDIEDRVAGLSQVRWEQLRDWVNAYAH